MGLFDAVGEALFGATGGKASAELNWKYQKEAMQNKHQWEAKDLEKAGFNPAITAKTGDASTGGAGGGGHPQGDLFGTIGSMLQSVASAKQAQSDANLKDIQAIGEAKKNGWIDKNAETALEEANSRIASNKATSALQTEKTKAAKYGKAAEYAGTEAAGKIDKMATSAIGAIKSFFGG